VVNKVVHAVETPDKGGLPAPGRADQGSDLAIGNIHIHLFQGLLGSVKEIQVMDMDE
jgi:hypothetical protein